jgi:hypothetical protein
MGKWERNVSSIRKCTKKRPQRPVELQLEIDKIGVTILERIVEALIELLDRAQAEADLEDGGESEPEAGTDPRAFCWAGDDRRALPAPRQSRRNQRRAA